MQICLQALWFLSAYNTIHTTASAHISSYYAKTLFRNSHTLKPFNDHASQYIGARFFGYNSPAAIARELFKPSMDATSLLDSIKKNFLIWVRGSPGRGSQSGGVLGF